MAYTRGGVRFLVFYADKRICILLAMGVDDFGVVCVIYRISFVYLSYIYRVSIVVGRCWIASLTDR